ncbi:hypothetical protein BCR33DRAFT_719223 [Rhizoclosmatium globosum]|uniref:Uncharacterized protein n=1 Tax=Rhizoclosmatium globosum TaxID=329046 RepID=A0A1Y2C1A0_9FUNG|nr:hypothetical protein BCR33DRAFT_719223 [Rhizoclosmatium globosum]|eukprot:ORY40674.1 hypothetical protein BCR33DRAFT_719223 [Rhizoclosmatium globosum]
MQNVWFSVVNFWDARRERDSARSRWNVRVQVEGFESLWQQKNQMFSGRLYSVLV